MLIFAAIQCTEKEATCVKSLSFRGNSFMAAIMLLLSNNSGIFQVKLTPIKGGFQEHTICLALVIRKLPSDSKDSFFSSPVEAVTI